MDSRTPGAARRFAGRRDTRRAPRNPALDAWTRLARHRLLRSLDDLRRSLATDRVAYAGSLCRFAAQAHEEWRVAGPGHDWHVRCPGADRDARIVARVADFRDADCGAWSQPPRADCDPRLRSSIDPGWVFRAASEAQRRILRFQRRFNSLATNRPARRFPIAGEQAATPSGRRRDGFDQSALARVGAVRQWPAAAGPHAFGLFADRARTRRAHADRLADLVGYVCAHAVAIAASRADRKLDRARNCSRRARRTNRIHVKWIRSLQLGRLGSSDDLLFDHGVELGCGAAVSEPGAVATGPDTQLGWRCCFYDPVATAPGSDTLGNTRNPFAPDTSHTAARSSYT